MFSGIEQRWKELQCILQRVMSPIQATQTSHLGWFFGRMCHFGVVLTGVCRFSL